MPLSSTVAGGNMDGQGLAGLIMVMHWPREDMELEEMGALERKKRLFALRFVLDQPRSRSAMWFFHYLKKIYFYVPSYNFGCALPTNTQIKREAYSSSIWAKYIYTVRIMGYLVDGHKLSHFTTLEVRQVWPCQVSVWLAPMNMSRFLFCNLCPTCKWL